MECDYTRVKRQETLSFHQDKGLFVQYSDPLLNYINMIVFLKVALK